MPAPSTLLILAEYVGDRGGMERYLDVVLPSLRARRDRVVVRARVVAAARAETSEIPWSDEHEEPNPAAEAAVRAEIDSLRPDAVVLQNVLDAGVVTAARSARHMVYQFHDHRPCCPNGDRVYPRTGRRCSVPMGNRCMAHSLIDGCMYGPRPRSLTLLRRREALRDAIVASDAVVANSPFLADRIARSGVGGAISVPLPLPDDAYVDGVPRSGDGSLLFVGRVEPQKGLRSLIRALALLEPRLRAPLRILGDGPELASCLVEAAERSVAVEALGRRDAGGVRAALDASSALVLPSLWDEPFGYVGIEAFARGRPVYAYDVGGVSWWLRHGRNGILIRPGDERGLADALRELGSHAELMGRAARIDAEAYRASAIVDRLRGIYTGA